MSDETGLILNQFGKPFTKEETYIEEERKFFGIPLHELNAMPKKGLLDIIEKNISINFNSIDEFPTRIINYSDLEKLENKLKGKLDKINQRESLNLDNLAPKQVPSFLTLSDYYNFFSTTIFGKEKDYSDIETSANLRVKFNNYKLYQDIDKIMNPNFAISDINIRKIGLDYSFLYIIIPKYNHTINTKNLTGIVNKSIKESCKLFDTKNNSIQINEGDFKENISSYSQSIIIENPEIDFSILTQSNGSVPIWINSDNTKEIDNSEKKNNFLSPQIAFTKKSFAFLNYFLDNYKKYLSPQENKSKETIKQKIKEGIFNQIKYSNF